MSAFRRPATYLVMAVLAALLMSAPAVADEEEPGEDTTSSTSLYPIAPPPGPAPAPAGGPPAGPPAAPPAEVANVQVEVGKNQPLPAVVAPAEAQAPAPADVEAEALAFTGLSVPPLAALALGFAALAVVLIRAGRKRQAGS